MSVRGGRRCGHEHQAYRCECEWQICLFPVKNHVAGRIVLTHDRHVRQQPNVFSLLSRNLTFTQRRCIVKLWKVEPSTETRFASLDIPHLSFDQRSESSEGVIFADIRVPKRR